MRRVKTNMTLPPCWGGLIPRIDIVPDQDLADGITETIHFREARTGAALGAAKLGRVWLRIMRSGSAALCLRGRKNVLLRTFDVRQIRRTVLGMRKAPEMKSNRLQYTQLAKRCQGSYAEMTPSEIITVFRGTVADRTEVEGACHAARAVHASYGRVRVNGVLNATPFRFRRRPCRELPLRSGGC
jgi:hypothetical protein